MHGPAAISGGPRRRSWQSTMPADVVAPRCSPQANIPTTSTAPICREPCPVTMPSPSHFSTSASAHVAQARSTDCLYWTQESSHDSEHSWYPCCRFSSRHARQTLRSSLGMQKYRKQFPDLFCDRLKMCSSIVPLREAPIQYSSYWQHKKQQCAWGMACLSTSC